MSRRRRGRRGTCRGSCSRAIAIQAALIAGESKRREELRSRVSVFCSVLQLVKKGGTVPLRSTKLSGWSCQSSKPASVARTKCEWLTWMWLCCGRGRVEIEVRARCIGSERVGQGGGREREFGLGREREVGPGWRAAAPAHASPLLPTRSPLPNSRSLLRPADRYPTSLARTQTSCLPLS